VNENDAKWKQLADRAEADRHTASARMWMDRRYLPAYFTYMQQHNKEMKWGKAFNRAARDRDNNMVGK
jgi:hypothetical protein